VTMPFYTSPEQLMRERSELARKGIARGRSVVVLAFADGVLFVAENHSGTLHKISEIYDRIGFAAVGRYPEFENLRVAGIRHADLRGYANDRRDVTGRSLANAYAQTLGAIFTEQIKPYEVELCLAEVGAAPSEDLLYRITYDGSIYEEPDFVVMGGTTEPISNAMREAYRPNMSLTEAAAAAVGALRSTATNSTAASADSARELGAKQLEVAVLDRRRPRRAFRRLVGAALDAILPGGTPEPEPPADAPADAPAAGDPGDSAADSGTGASGAAPATEASAAPDAAGEKPSRPATRPRSRPTGDPGTPGNA
jgi:proteasome alpha subunit